MYDDLYNKVAEIAVREFVKLLGNLISAPTRNKLEQGQRLTQEELEEVLAAYGQLEHQKGGGV